METLTKNVLVALMLLCGCARSGPLPSADGDGGLQEFATADALSPTAPSDAGAGETITTSSSFPEADRRECGNGIREGAELCDGPDCPTQCVDAVCVRAELRGSASACDAQCVTTEISACAHGDGCCPEGCTYASDDDCSPSCGDGVISGTEVCEPGSLQPCPQAADCDDHDPCTHDKVVGSTQQCSAHCANIPITQPAPGDMCCPSGANVGTDSDCAAFCGDGVVSKDEQCDPAVRGSCPTRASCDALTVGCKRGVLVGTGCDARCEVEQVRSAAQGDQCCPAGADVSTDSDCEPRCADGVLSANEECDPNLPIGDYGRCPQTDNDCSAPASDPCQQGVLLGDPLLCTARCVFDAREVGLRDACCPSGASAREDPDCSPVCGNGILEDGETCDSGPGGLTPCPSERTCPTEPCNARRIVGSGCTATCEDEVVPLRDGDGCCPNGATASSDLDCHDGVEGYWSECSWPKAYSPGWEDTTNLAPPEASRLYGCDGTVAVCMSGGCVPACEPSDTRAPDGWEGYCFVAAHPPVFEIFCGPNDSCPAPRQCVRTAQHARNLCR